MLKTSVPQSLVLAAALIIVGATAAQSRQPAVVGSEEASLHPVLQPGRCYRLVFPIPGAPSYKVLEIGRGSWIKAEVDAGPASVPREPLWINARQIVTMRPAACSA